MGEWNGDDRCAALASVTRENSDRLVTDLVEGEAEAGAEAEEDGRE
jgi:hypothetical protein